MPLDPLISVHVVCDQVNLGENAQISRLVHIFSDGIMQQPPFYMLEVQFKMLHTDNHVRQIGSKMKSATAMCIYSLVKDLDQLMQAS